MNLLDNTVKEFVSGQREIISRDAISYRNKGKMKVVRKIYYLVDKRTNDKLVIKLRDVKELLKLRN